MQPINTMTIWNQIKYDITAVTQLPFAIENRHSIGGGCINSAYQVSDGERTFFVKTNRANLLSMFEAEFAGLNEIYQTNTIRVPQPICCGSDKNTSYLVMEYLELNGSNSASAEKLGQNLAAMHRVTSTHYGWTRTNTIGSTTQLNAQMNDWSTFWREQRLAFQLNLAKQNGYTGRLQRDGEQLLSRIEDFFTDYTPEAALLHGDLWSGNYAVTAGGQPVIFDPATYYGDRETDIAMTELFGGFPAGFYAAYQEAYPLNTGYAIRKTLYNLYHILNHLNLFGSGYLSQAERMIGGLLSEIK